MGNISGQVKSEIRQLPFMIGKAVGGIMAVIGFTAAVVIITRRAAPSFADILPYALVGCLGVFLFVLSSRLMARRLAENAEETPGPGDRTRTSMLSWAILLLLAALFLLWTYLPVHGDDLPPVVPDPSPITSPGFPSELSGKCVTMQGCLEYCKSHPSEQGCERFIGKRVTQ